MNKKHVKKLEESVPFKAAVAARNESIYLISSNKEKCSYILSKKDLTEEDTIDFLVALHIVLEISLNSLFRNLSLMGIKKKIDAFEIARNIDEISFIHKTTLFIYNSKFNFSGKQNEATSNHSIIGMLKNFSAPRNKLLHGHSISTIFAGDEQRDSALRQSINSQYLNDQIQKFRKIMEGMRFYLDCLDSSLTPSGKESFKKEYLDDHFLL